MSTQETTDCTSRLAQFRESLGLKQNQLAEILGISADTYRTYEKRSIPPPSVLKSLHSQGLNLNWLFTGKGTITHDFDKIGKLVTIRKDEVEEVIGLLNGILNR